MKCKPQARVRVMVLTLYNDHLNLMKIKLSPYCVSLMLESSCIIASIS